MCIRDRLWRYKVNGLLSSHSFSYIMNNIVAITYSESVDEIMSPTGSDVLSICRKVVKVCNVSHNTTYNILYVHESILIPQHRSQGIEIKSPNNSHCRTRRSCPYFSPRWRLSAVLNNTFGLARTGRKVPAAQTTCRVFEANKFSVSTLDTNDCRQPSLTYIFSSDDMQMNCVETFSKAHACRVVLHGQKHSFTRNSVMLRENGYEG